MAHLPQRHSIRRPGYDYANVGAYFLTMCTNDRRHWFGHIADGVWQPSPIGEWAQRCWDAIPEHMPHVEVGDFVVMPNHVHGIVVIRERLVDVHGRAMDGGTGADARASADPVGADHGRPDTMPNDTMRPDTMPDAMPTADHDRPDTMSDAMPTADHDRPDTVWYEPTVAVNNVPDDHTTNAPHAQCRADHDRPLRPPTDPPAPTPPAMPTVPHGSLGRIVRAYKSAVTRMAYRDGLVPHGTPIWQRNYWDHIIRDDGEWFRIARYIQNNPRNWKGDRFNR